MTIHHKPAQGRAIEYAKSRDTMAHRLITPNAPGGVMRSTRGGPVALAGVHGSAGAVDIQPRHGGKPKGYDVHVTPGHRSRTSPLPGMLHMTDVRGVPVADAPDPIDPTERGKRQPPCMVHPGMTKKQVAGACLNGEDVLKEGLEHSRNPWGTLPDQTTEN